VSSDHPPGSLGAELDSIDREITAIVASTPWWKRWLVRLAMPSTDAVRADIARRRNESLGFPWNDA